MSVKDKIAMWNSMGANSNNPPPPQPKYSSTFVPKTSPAPTAATGHLTAKPAELNKTPSNNEKKWEVDTGSIKTTPAWMKSQDSGLKPAPVVTSKPVVVPPSTGEQEKILKPSEIKKKLESMSAGKGLYFAAPPQPAARIEQPPSNNPGAESTNYEVQKGPITVNVKQNAEKLNQFYQKQHMLQARKAQQVPKEVQKPTEEHKHEKQEESAHGQPHQEVHHQSAALFKHTESHTEEPETKKEEHHHAQHAHTAEPAKEHTATIESKPQTTTENKPDEMSLATRIKRRKMKQASFDSDDD